MEQQNVPGIQGIDTRELTKKIRERGTMLGRIVYDLPLPTAIKIVDPNTRNLVSEVSIKVQYNVGILEIVEYKNKRIFNFHNLHLLSYLIK